MRTIRLHTFCSVKGGVGKSTLAVACAKLLADKGRHPVLIDCDMTGSSLSDGLRLCAPKVELDHGRIDFSAPPTGAFYTREETCHLQRKRAEPWDGAPPPPPFLNDVLRHDHLVRVDSLLWKHQREDGVYYLPSSSLFDDVGRSLQWLVGESFDWVHRLTWVVDSLLVQMPFLTDIVVDLPPGVWGFTHEMLVVVSKLSLHKPLPEGYPNWHEGFIEWKTNPFLILSSDRNDLLPSLQYLARTVLDLPTLLPVLNRSTEGIRKTRQAVRELLGPVLAPIELEKKLESIDELRPTLGRVFLDQDLMVNDQIKTLSAMFRLEDEP